ncbi:MAG: penicillin-binding protein activator, partial [Steroidobacteraceae bacterium]
MFRVRTLLPTRSMILLGLVLLVGACATRPPESAPPAAAGPTEAQRAAAAASSRAKQSLPAPAQASAAAGVPGAEPHVALLLPLTGRQSGAAATVRDGFLTAYYVGPTAGRPRVRIYDTGSIGVAQAIDTATRGGAWFIVGPLTREAVAAAAQLPAPRPPILALNFLPAGSESPANFYQFALSPEGEAHDVAMRVLADGHQRGVALAPDGDWGTRVLTAFRAALTAGGGTLLAVSRYDPLRTSYAPAITDVLGIDESTDRYRRVRSIVGGKLAFQPRLRGDIEFIFAPGSAASARLLTPQLKYFFAGNLPTYATSEAFEPNPSADEDLEGLEFPGMPWMLGSGLADSVRLAASAAWPVGGPPRNRLFAFGFDAYRLLLALHAEPGTASPEGSLAIEGLTGQLTLDATGHVHRQLEWAQMHDGQPRLLAPPQPAPAPAPAPA